MRRLSFIHNVVFLKLNALQSRMPDFFLRRALPLARLLGLPLVLLLSLPAPARAGDAAPACKYVNVAELPLRYLGSSFHPAVDGFINDSPSPMLIDTGAYKSMLTRRATDRLDLALRMTGTYVNGVGGSSRVYGARINSFVVGPTRSRGMMLGVIDEMGMRPDFDAIVGADFLFQADFEIALADKQLRFFRAQDCKDSFLGYWGKDIVDVPLTGSFGDSRNQTFTVELNGVKLDAIIDSGASHSFVFVGAARKAGVDIDSPGTLKARDAVGIGPDRLAQWRAVFKTFAIGGELIRDAELGISATPESGRMHADILLGADFLRAHRVLFAMSQKRLYIGYLGGEIFSRGPIGIEPWLQKEADGGNPEAQFALANKYRIGNSSGSSSGVAKDIALAASWMQKAAQQGHAGAGVQVGVGLLHTGHSVESANLLSRSAAQRPDDTRLPLYLYLARLQGGDAAIAARELDLRFAADKERRWPAPVADFYLGRLDAGALLAAAAKEPALAFAQGCEAKQFVAELARAKGDKEGAKSLMEARRADCARPPAN
jgi:predicted aspartyl protease